MEFDTLFVESLTSSVNIINSNSNVTKATLYFLAVLRASGIGVANVVYFTFQFFRSVVPRELEAAWGLECKFSSFSGILGDFGLVTVCNKVVGEAPLGEIVVKDEVHSEDLAVKFEGHLRVLDSVAGLLHYIFFAFSWLLNIIIFRAIKKLWLILGGVDHL